MTRIATLILALTLAGCVTLPVERFIASAKAAQDRAIAAHDTTGAQCWASVGLIVEPLVVASRKPVGPLDLIERDHILAMMLRTADAQISDACAPLRIDIRAMIARALGLRRFQL